MTDDVPAIQPAGQQEVNVPAQIKEDNWTFHILARSDDPAIKCLNIGNLITNLKTTMWFAKITEYDTLLERNGRGANRAWYEYTELRNPGQAVQTAKQVLEEVLFLVYDKRFTTMKQNSFGGRK